MDIVNSMKDKTKEIDKIIESYLPKEEGFQKEIFEAFNYSILAGGKRIRPMIMMETYRLFADDTKDSALIAPFMAAMEMIHTYSLVHDDLPAMDNDMYRRGKLTTHAKFGEATGILAGDALLNGAFETAGTVFDTIAKTVKKEEQVEYYQRAAKALQVLSRHAGMYGMIGGQVVDVANTKKQLTTDTLDFIYDLKTGALLRASFLIGAIMAGASNDELSVLNQIAKNVGLAFQIQDDILDVTSTTEELGKPVHSDEKNEKTTYVTIHGIEKSQEMVRTLSEEAIEQLKSFHKKDEFLNQFIQYLITRKK